MINYAHRGASQYYPENTLYAFYAGLHMGADGIETDIQRTLDGVPVLFHDRTLERILGDPRRIALFFDLLRRFFPGVSESLQDLVREFRFRLFFDSAE